MILFHGTRTSIRPCIVSIARFALELKEEIPVHNPPQRCTLSYWINVLDTLCLINRIDDQARRQRAINRFNELINNL
jgi:hypothetical protein